MLLSTVIFISLFITEDILIIEDNSDISIDKWIYKIRNTAVHLSFDNKKDVDINKILSSDIVVKTLIPIVVELYSSMLA